MSDVIEETKTDAEESEQEAGKMSFLDHLDELRKRLVRITIYLAVGFCACFFFSPRIYNFLAIPINREVERVGGNLIYTSPTDAFTISMKVALLAGIFLTLPFTLFEVWQFISPGLYRREKRYVIPFLFFSVLLFLAGATFCYRIALPGAFEFLTDWGANIDNVKPQIDIGRYLDLTNTMLLGFGLIFEMPVVVAFLSLFGLVSAGFLIKKFRYALVGIVILAAIISPTSDAVNLLIWSAPMVLLYIVSIGVAAVLGRRRKKKNGA
ncbi:MAG: twin-arginine translocase subunit TatC [Acidobacteriota bacterium]|jgi:sec-independent protein translocase protein TatC|nr:twin-arginine translocase subunit TatC [Acidobacteriota bacterium]